MTRLDKDADLLFDDDRRFKMAIVGRSALILLETVTRAIQNIIVPRVLAAIDWKWLNHLATAEDGARPRH